MSIKKIKRKNGYVYQVRLQDSTGKDYYKTFSKRKYALEFEQTERLKKITGYVKSTDVKHGKHTISDIFIEYEKSVFSKIRSGTRMSYIGYMKNYINPEIGLKRIRVFNKNDLSVFESGLIESGLSFNSIQNIVSFVSTLFNFAVDDLNWVDKSLVKNYKTKRKDKKSEPLFWEKEEIDYFFNNEICKNNYYYKLYIFLLNTGCRIGEAGALKVEHIDFKRNRIYIGWTLSKNDYKSNKYKGIYFSLNRQKGANDRFVPISKQCRSILKQIVKAKKGSDFVFTNRPKTNRDLVYIKGDNKDSVISAPIINSQHFSHKRFRALQKDIGVDKERIMGAHGLRHTFASHFVMNGGDIYSLSKILGHSSVKITEIYAHLSPSHMDNIDDFISF